jgi:hypothetical protein
MTIIIKRQAMREREREGGRQAMREKQAIRERETNQE